jgi:hypothetical protein
MKLINFYRRKEGDSGEEARLSLFLDDTPATRLGFGLNILLPKPIKMQPRFDTLDSVLVPHIPSFGFHFRWRAKHVEGKRTLVRFYKFWFPQ